MTIPNEGTIGARSAAAIRGGVAGGAVAGVLGVVSATLEGLGLANMTVWTFGALMVGLMVFPGWACAVALVPVRRKTVTARELSLLAATGAFFCVAVVFGGMVTSQARIAALPSIANRGDAIVAAVEAFVEVHGRYPRRLEDLTPELLGEVPPTGNVACPRFGYDRTRPTSERPWVRPSFRVYVYCADALDVMSLTWSSAGPPVGSRIIGSGWYYGSD